MTAAQPPTRDSEVCFETSGITGQAVRWIRTREQLAHEAELIGNELAGPVDLVVSYAPPRHLFGALFGEWLPRLRGIPVVDAWEDLFTFPSIVARSRVLVVCVPTAWRLLHRHWTALGAARSVVALHSAAAPPPAAYDLVRDAAPLLRAHEILGSTETGGIAHRPIEPECRQMPWQAFDDVSLIRAQDSAEAASAELGHTEPLVLASPRIARREGTVAPPACWSTGDLVQYVGSGQFRLVGRSSSLIKVDGQRVHLSQVDDLLGQRLPGIDVATLPCHGDALTGEGYAVFWAAGDSGTGLSDIREALRDLPSPARVIRLPRVPMTTVGKPDARVLASLLQAPDQL
jgi:acyl-coenzyme A synthetase/AMP-(fatty) acid ligase